MPLTTVICPDCGNTITTDVPSGHKATIEHREEVDILRVKPRVMPIFRPNTERGGTANATNRQRDT